MENSIGITHEEYPNTIVFFISGNLELDTMNIFRNYYESHTLNADEKVIAFDMENVAFIDSSGIASLIKIYQEMRGKGKNFYCINPSAEVTGIFQATKILDFFKVYTKEEFKEKYI